MPNPICAARGLHPSRASERIPCAYQPYRMENSLAPGMPANFSPMNVREGSVPAERQAFPEPEFLAWLDEETTTVLISENHDQFYAYCVEFGISGSGPTKEAAVQDAVTLLMGYLVVSFSEGRPYRSTKKRPPAWIRLKSWYLIPRRKVLRKIKPLSRLGWLTSVPTTNHDSHRLAL
jgi:hypothetical protein